MYGAAKAYVLAPSRSMQHELANKGLRIPAVLLGATATEIWEIASLPYQNLPAEIVISPEDVVDAALVGPDPGELVTIPPLHDGDKWTRFEATPRAISSVRQVNQVNKGSLRRIACALAKAYEAGAA